MTSRRVLAAVFLFSGAAASAQRVVRLAPVPLSAPRASSLPAAALPSFPAASLAAPSAALPLVPALAPAAAPLPAAAPAAAALPPGQARAAVLTGALADFSRTDLKTASSAEARGAGEVLMLRALGGADENAAAVPAGPSDGAPALLAAPPVAERPAGPRVYLLSKPLRETVRLGPLALAAHAAYALGWEVLKAWIGWTATGSPMGAVAVLAVELPFSPAMVTVRSLVDLGQRYWRRKLAVLRELARTPGVERVRVLTTGEVKFMGPLARSKDNTGLIFVESSSELPETVGRFGAPIPISDVEAQRVRLTLVGADGKSVETWTPSLSHLLEGRPLPPGVAAAWRAALSPGKAPVKILLDAARISSLRVDAALIGSDGSEKPLGSIADGPAVKTLIGLGHLDRVRAWLGWERTARRLPVSDTVVERPGAAREPGWTAALSRAWRRLSGRLIVAR